MAIKYLSSITLENNELQNAKLQPAATPPTIGVPAQAEGRVYYDTANDQLKAHNGTAWYSVNGDVETITSANTNLLTVSGTSAITLTPQVAAISNGGVNLATGAQIYDFVVGQGYLTALTGVSSIVQGTGISVNASVGDVTITNSDRGSSQNIFKNVAVSGQATLVADNNNDTLTFVQAGATTITTTVGSDQIQIFSQDTTYTQGSGISFSGTQINHADTSTAANLTASARTYVDALTFDTYGHVTAYSTSTETVSNSNTTYSVSVAAGAANDADIVLTAGGSGSGTDLITISGITNETTVTESGDTIYIGLPDDVQITNNLTVGGNLTVNGTVTTVNTETINLADNIITLNSNYTLSSPTEDGGIEIERGTLPNTSLFWDESADRWAYTDTVGTYNIPKTGEYNPTIGTNTNFAAATGIQYVNGITLTNGVITAYTAGNVRSALTTQTGVVELATNAETAAGTDATRAVTPAGLASVISGGTLSTSNHTSVLIGNGTLTTITATHGFGLTSAYKVMVQLVEVSTGETIYAEVGNRTTNTVDIVFAVAPATNSIAVLMTKMEY